MDDVVRRLVEDGWEVEYADVYTVWCRRGCKVSVPPRAAARRMRVYVLSRGGRRVLVYIPLEG